MGRPRLVDSGLPKNVYARRGSLYLVTGGKWERIGSASDQPKAYLDRPQILAYAYRVLTRAKQNAKGRGIPFALERADIAQMLEGASWRCAVSNTLFSVAEEGHRRQRPYAPSIDRRDSSQGYTPRNCRLVCVAVNLAMNCWGEDVLIEIAQNMAAKARRSRRSIRHQLDSAS